MSLLGKIFGTSGDGGDPTPGLVDGLLGMIQRQAGGLDGFLHQFREKGLGEIVGSWVRVGENLPITADDVKKVFTMDQLKEMAAKTGTTVEAVTAKLTGILPNVVDKLTPGGAVPDGGLLDQAIGLLRSALGKK
jgi:uncharacterized protein YidB (DUF937 family)